MNADVGQDARLYGTGGRVKSLFSALVASAGTRSRPEGGAMAEVLERFVTSASEAAMRDSRDTEWVVRERLADLRQYRSGPEFADVVLAYADGVRRNDEERRESALRWIRGEYRTKTQAKQALGVNGIIGDADFYPSLRLLALLVGKAGYGGLIVELDELAVLARLNRLTRDQNYEQILTMVNSLLAGQAKHLGLVLAGTPEFVTDPVRGLYSYGALRARLMGSEFDRPGLKNTASPVITLEPLAPEDLWVLLENVHRVYCSNENRDPLPDLEQALAGFLDHSANQLGGLAKVTPREATRSWISFLDILSQNRKESWRNLLGQVDVSVDDELAGSGPANEIEIAAFLPAPAGPSGGEALADFSL